MFTLKIETDNAAFEDSPSWEVARILEGLINKLRTDTMAETGVAVDFNGNIVGRWELTS